MRLLVWLVFPLLVTETYALEPSPSQFVLDSWNTGTGLLEETIYSVQQTGDGYLWLATANGLVRYDGSSFQVRQPREDLGVNDRPFSIHSPDPSDERRVAFKQEIVGIGRGARNSLWLYSPSYGLVRYEHGLFRSTAKYPTPCHVEQMKEDRDGTLAICSERILRLAGDTIHEIARIPVGSVAAIKSAALDEKGKLWIGLAVGGVAELKRDGSLSVRYGPAEGIPAGPINTLAVARDGLWVGTDHGLALIKGNTVQVFTTQDGLSSSDIRQLTFDRDGTLWVGTMTGLNLYRNGHFESFASVKGIPSDSRVNGIFIDREESVWVNFSDTGLFRFAGRSF